MDNKKILIEENAGVLTLTLNNPSKMNCMGFEMLNQLNAAINDADANNNKRSWG